VKQGVAIDISGAPTSFMIFPSGEFMTDDGPHVMNTAMAEAIVSEFNARGNQMSVDYDHASVSVSAPPESRVAAGWIARLEARGLGEVWACDVVWTQEASGWILSEPPKYRYISPYYDCMTDGNKAYPVRIKNVALTNNPKTWFCTRLASLASDGKTMNDNDKMLAGMTLLALLGLMGASDAALAAFAKEQDSALRAKLGDQADAAMQLASAGAPSATAPVLPAPAAASAAVPLPDDKAMATAAASLAAIKTTAVQRAKEREAIKGLIVANKGNIPENAIPLLMQASLVEATKFIADLSTTIVVTEKRVADIGAGTVVERKDLETRAASLATTHGIKDVGALKTRLASN